MGAWEHGDSADAYQLSRIVRFVYYSHVLRYHRLYSTYSPIRYERPHMPNQLEELRSLTPVIN